MRDFLIKERLNEEQLYQFLLLVFDFPPRSIILHEYETPFDDGIDYEGKIFCEYDFRSSDVGMNLSIWGYKDELDILNGLCHACYTMGITLYLDVDNFYKYLCIDHGVLYDMYMDENRMDAELDENGEGTCGVYFYPRGFRYSM